MMSFVDKNPVRPAALRAELLNVRKQRREKDRPFIQSYSGQVDHGVVVGLRKYLQHRWNAWRTLLIAQSHSSRKPGIIAFRIDDQVLVRLFLEAFKEAHGERRLAAAGSTCY